MMQLALRAVAVAIAVAGVVDPVVTLERPVAGPLTIAVAERASPVRHATGSSAWALALRLRESLEGDFQVSMQSHDGGSRAAACPLVGGCILVSDGPLPARLSEGAVMIGALRVVGAGPRVTITAIDSRRYAHVDAASKLDVHVETAGATVRQDQRQASTSSQPAGAIKLQVFDGHALVGTAEHRWPGITVETRPASLPVEWVPLAAGPRRLRVVASLVDADHTVSSDDAETAVDVRTEPARVLLHEPEATWMGTFARRAIEADARFRLDARTQVAPGISVSRGGQTGLGREQIDDVAVVIVTAPERLTVSDVDLLERYMRVRGGSVVLLPGVEPSGPVTRLIPPIARVQHEPEPQVVGQLRARDLLTFASSPDITALASIAERPVIVARGIGRGRVVVSGAMDAWRYRAGSGFSRFWTSLVADAAAAGAPLRFETSGVLLTPGEEASFGLEWRTLGAIGPGISAEAELDCGGERRSIRLWPEARIGSFVGSIAGAPTGTCVVTAAVAGSRDEARTAILVAGDVRRPIPDARAFADAIAARGGIVEEAGGEASLAARARDILRPARASHEVRPMASPWWIVPFAACLCIEWALRRRVGER